MPTREELVAAFRTFDISGDGLISAQEFTSILMRGDGGLSYGDAQSLISQFDVNGDGQLDVNEFCAMMGSSSAVSTLAGKHAPGIGTAFEFLDEYNNWQLITGADVINQLGKLCAFNTVTQVQYSVGHNNYSVTQQRNGDLVQTNVATGVQRNLRLVPFFFEYEEGPNNWKPVTQPEALTALTAVLASSAEKTYTVYMPGYTGHYTANLLNEQGLIKQQNTQTGKQRRIRATPVGPDGQPHFEFRDGPVGSGVWKPVADSCVKQLAAVAASRGEAFFQITYPEGHTFHYKAHLDTDGFVIQQNVKGGIGKERPIRPAPWRGHGAAIAPERRVDPTEGYVPRRGEEVEAPPRASREGRRAAAEFYTVEHVELGRMEAPVMLREEIPMAMPVGPPQVYYYQPQIMDPNDMALPMAMPY